MSCRFKVQMYLRVGVRAVASLERIGRENYVRIGVEG
jgi:hypothetical protein